MRIVSLLLSAVLLTACASTTPYQSQRDGYGYTEQILEPNRVRVSFAGSSATSRETVENYLLYRAAEVTLARGFDYFVMTKTQTEARSGNSPSVNLGFGGFGFGSRSGVGLGVGTSTGGDKRAYTAQSEVLMFRGGKPAGDPQAFDAREVRSNLEARIQRSAPPK